MDIKNVKKKLDGFLEGKVVPLDNKIKAAIFVVVMLLPVVAFFFFFVSPKNNEIKGFNSQITNLEREIGEAKAKAAEKEKYEAELRDTETMFREASILLPQNKEIPSLLTNISSLGINSGLNFLSFQPGGESPQEFYAEIPINITVRGPYHNIGYYLYRLTKLGRIVSVKSISLGAPQMEAGERMLSSNISLATYKFVEAPPEAAGEKPKQ